MHTLCIMTSSRFAGLSLAGFIQCFHQIVMHTNWFESYEAAVICKDDTWRDFFQRRQKQTRQSKHTSGSERNFTQTCSSIDLWMSIQYGTCSLTKSLSLKIKKIKTFFYFDVGSFVA